MNGKNQVVKSNLIEIVDTSGSAPPSGIDRVPAIGCGIVVFGPSVEDILNKTERPELAVFGVSKAGEEASGDASTSG